jgi:SAM-dependent methyltransferase
MGEPHDPKFWRSDYIHLRALGAQMKRAVADHLGGREAVDVVDVGCGTQPYRSLFGSVGKYVGVDLAEGPYTDVVATAEELPFDDESFDCYLCNQMLHYSPTPERVIAEAHRVLRPGGLALISTHGLAIYQSYDGDYWRWTHQGLETLIAGGGPWRSVDVYPNGGAASGAVYIVGIQVEFLADRLGRATHPAASQLIAGPTVAALNAIAWNADRRMRKAFPKHAPVAAPNYLAVAIRP